MSEDRFNALLSSLLDGEVSAADLAELVDLARGNPSREWEIQAQLETSEMIALSEDELRDPALFLAALQSRISEDPFVSRVRSGIRLARRPRVWRALNPWSLATAAGIALLGISLFVWQSREEAVIAELVQARGAIQWTGNDGRVEDRMEAGRLLTGGTLESLTLDALATVRFPDQTSITVYGNSTLTLAANRQKVLHLRGNLAAEVTPQPSGRALLIHTPAADLEVLGTRFSVASDSAQTKVAVNVGKVRLTQRADDSKVEVPASHLAVASIDAAQELTLRVMRPATNAWIANLVRDVEHGDWISAIHAWRLEVARAMEAGEMTEEDAGWDFAARAVTLQEDAGSLQARPARMGDARGVGYLASLSATRGLSGPVILGEGGKFRVQGKVQSPTVIAFAFSALDLNGTSADRNLTRRQVAAEFNLELPLGEFESMTGAGRASPWGKQLIDWHCFTADREAALEITALELSGATAE